MLKAAARKGIATYEDHNASMMEGAGGAALANVLVRDGERSSVFRSYIGPILTQGNLTILTHATVSRVLLEGLDVWAWNTWSTARSPQFEAARRPCFRSAR